MMPRPEIKVPLYQDLKSIDTLLSDGLTHEQIAEYYQGHEMEIEISRQTVGNKVKEMKIETPQKQYEIARRTQSA